MKCRLTGPGKKLCGLVLLTALITASSAVAAYITVPNFSFEYVNGNPVTTRLKGVTPDDWTFEVGDNLNGPSPQASEGNVCVAVAGVNSIYQTLSDNVATDTAYTLKFDGYYHYSTGAWNCTFRGILYYKSGNSRVEIGHVEYRSTQSYEWKYDCTLDVVIPSGHAAVGKQLGIELAVVSQSGSTYAFDNVRLTSVDVSQGPTVYNPAPSNSAVEVRTDTGMSWEVQGANNPTFDINIGTDTKCNDVVSGFSTGSSQSYTPALIFNTEYFWRVDVTDGGTEYPGPVWSFTTGPGAKAAYPIPESGGTANRLIGKLGWCGDPAIHSYAVYFGAPGNLQFVDSYFLTDVPFDDLAGALGEATLPAGDYQWRVDTLDTSGALIAAGDVWDVTIPAVLPATPVTKPNILYILVDDMGFADIDANVDDAVFDLEFNTPHIDTIFNGGVRFDAGYVCNSVCAPSRAGLITGRHGGRFGFGSNVPELSEVIATSGMSKMGLAPGEKTIPDLLKTVGYKTFGVGKWHLGYDVSQYHPNLRGFDEWYGLLGGSRTYFQLTGGYQLDHSLEYNGVEVSEPSDMYMTDFLTDQALAYMTEQMTNHPAQPWFMYLSYTAPHGPMDAKRTDINRVPKVNHFSSNLSTATGYSVMETDGSIVYYTTKDQNLLRQVYGAMMVNLDDNVGRVLDQLDALGITDNTLIVFHSDNGGPTDGNWSINNPLKGGKGTLYEGGVRVPFAIQWPGTIPSNQVFGAGSPVSSLDMLPTFAAVSGADIRDLDLDGVNLMPLLKGSAPTTADRQLFWRRGTKTQAATRSGDMKYFKNRNTGDEYLYDVVTDISESFNKINNSAYESNKLRLINEYSDWEDTVPDPAWSAWGDNLGPLLSITTYSLDVALRGEPYAMQMAHNTPDGGTGTWSIVSGKPDWLSIDPATGMLSGTPGPVAPAKNYIRFQIDYAGETSTFNLPLRVLDGYLAWAKMHEIELDGQTGDSDGDGSLNLMEFAVGGNPTNSSDIGYVPNYAIVNIGGGVQRFTYVYPRRTDWQDQGLGYDVSATTNLTAGPWVNDMHSVDRVEYDGFGPGFDAVTNHLSLDNAIPSQFIRMEVDE